MDFGQTRQLVVAKARAFRQNEKANPTTLGEPADSLFSRAKGVEQANLPILGRGCGVRIQIPCHQRELIPKANNPVQPPFNHSGTRMRLVPANGIRCLARKKFHALSL